MKIGVLGGTGFIGSSVVSSGTRLGLDIAAVDTVRVAATATDDFRSSLRAWHATNPARFERQCAALEGFDVVINAAGLALPGARRHGELFSANTIQPAVAAHAAWEVGSVRFVHVSTAAVQGRLNPLDETERHIPLSPYAASKAAGERLVLERRGRAPAEVVVYRPTSVFGPDRPAARALARLASTLPALPLCGDGDQPVPVALIDNVAAGIVFAAASASAPPIVLQPWEGLTARALLELFGAPRLVSLPPKIVARAFAAERRRLTRFPAALSRQRWLELVLRGQAVRAHALTAAGFSPPKGREAWTALALHSARGLDLTDGVSPSSRRRFGFDQRAPRNRTS